MRVYGNNKGKSNFSFFNFKILFLMVVFPKSLNILLIRLILKVISDD